MIQAIGKRFSCIGTDIFEISENGMCCGAEWLDEFGNSHRMVWVRCLAFSAEAEYAEMLYKIFIKPKGLDEWIYSKDIIDQIGRDKYFHSVFPSSNFGTREYAPFDEVGILKIGLSTQVQFFADNFIFNIHGLPMSFKQFIYPFIELTQNVEVV